MTIAQSRWSSWTWLTLFNLLTLGTVQASLAQLSLNRKFQDLSAEKDKKRLAARCWNKFTLFNLLTLGTVQASLTLLSLNRKFQHDILRHLLFYTLIFGETNSILLFMGKVGTSYAASQRDTCHPNVFHVSGKIFTFSFSMRNAVGNLAKLSCENIFFPIGKFLFPSWKIIFFQLGTFFPSFRFVFEQF